MSTVRRALLCVFTPLVLIACGDFASNDINATGQVAMAITGDLGAARVDIVIADAGGNPILERSLDGTQAAPGLSIGLPGGNYRAEALAYEDPEGTALLGSGAADFAVTPGGTVSVALVIGITGPAGGTADVDIELQNLPEVTLAAVVPNGAGAELVVQGTSADGGPVEVSWLGYGAPDVISGDTLAIDESAGPPAEPHPISVAEVRDPLSDGFVTVVFEPVDGCFVCGDTNVSLVETVGVLDCWGNCRKEYNQMKEDCRVAHPVENGPYIACVAAAFVIYVDCLKDCLD